MVDTTIVYAGGHYMVRDVYEAWNAAGRPPINSGGRLYGEQKYLYDSWKEGRPGFFPADNPDRPDLYPLGHVRFAALDIDATPERVRRLSEAGLIRPFPWESWHWAPRNIYDYPLVYAIPPGVANLDVTDFPGTVTVIDEGDDTMRHLYTKDNGGNLWTLVNVGTGELVQTREQSVADTWAEAWGSARVCSVQAFLNALHAVHLTTDPDNQNDTELRKLVESIRDQLAKLGDDAPVVEAPKA